MPLCHYATMPLCHYVTHRLLLHLAAAEAYVPIVHPTPELARPVDKRTTKEQKKKKKKKKKKIINTMSKFENVLKAQKVRTN